MRAFGFLAGVIVVGVVCAMLFAGGGEITTGTGSGGGGGPVTAAAPAAETCVPAGKAAAPGLTAAQAAIAREGVAAAKRGGVGDAGARVIIAAGLVESELNNLNHGDRDSLGWLQQRASQGWKNATNPARAADDFITALKAVKGWQQMAPGDAAQKVQRSGFPDRYGQRMQEATRIVAALGGGAVAECKPPAAAANPGSCPATGKAAEKGLKPAALKGLRCGLAAFPKIVTVGGVGGRPNKSDHPNGRAVDFMIPGWSTTVGRAFGWTVAKWWEQAAESMGVKYLIWDAKIWRPSTRKWSPYKHPTGGTSPTLLHLDHVHVSFNG